MKSVLGLSVAFGVFASLVVRAELPDAVGLREIATAGTNHQTLTVTGTHLIEGTVRKTGSGAWTVPAATVFSGSRAAWDVLAGSVALTGIGAGGEMELAAAPAAVLNQAALWMAADENVIYTDNGGVNEVSAWLDVREPDTAAPYVYMRAVSKTNFTNAVPELKTSGAGPDNALPYLWFGGYHSGRWMDWTDPADASKHLNTIHHVFVVHGTHDSYGYFLGITESDATTFPLDFRKDDYSSASGATGMIWENAAYGYTATALRTGRTFLNRVLVDGAATPVPRDYQLICAEVGCRPANAGNFFNCRNLYENADGARVGGDRLCEAVIFTNRLSETDRIKVEHYLWQKWFGRAPQAPGGLNVAAGATGTVDVASAATLDFQMQGDGYLIKQGTGTLRVNVDKDTPLTTLNNSLAYTEGTVDARVPVTLAAAAGVCYSNHNFILRRSAADAGTIVKTGNGDVAVAEIPSGARVKVNTGVLQIDQPLAAIWPTDMRGGIPNPTFEGLATSQKTFADGETFGGWTATVVDTSSVRIITDDQWYFSGSPLMPYPTPDGTCFLLLKGVGHIQTTFTLPAAGVYALSFLASGRRAGKDGHSFDIIIDDTTRVATVSTYSTEWQQYRYRLPWLSAGEHTLLLKTVSTGDIASGLDDFRLDLVDTTEYVNVVSNACFECVAPGNFAKTFTFETGTGKGWEFSNGGNGGYVHVKAQGPLFHVYDTLPPRIIAGSSACNLQEFGRRNLYFFGDGIAATTVTFPAAGDYILSLRVCRTRFGNLDWSAASELTVMIDGCVTQIITTARDVYETKTIGPFTVPADMPLTLKLSGTANKCLMLVDDLLVSKAFATDLIRNGGFETETDWNFVNDPEALATNKVLAERFNYAYYTDYYGTNVFEGSYRLKLCDTGAAWQTVTVNEPGVYQFVCHAISRELGSNGQNPIVVKLIAGGVTNVIGRFTSYNRTFRRHAFLFNAPVAGDYTLLLEGQTPWAGKIGETFVNDRTTLIDNVSMRKVQVDEDGLRLPEETVIEVAADAKLNLNFIGTNKIDTVRYEGKTISGHISNATHPEFVDGAGVLYTSAKGTLLRVL